VSLETLASGVIPIPIRLFLIRPFVILIGKNQFVSSILFSGMSCIYSPLLPPKVVTGDIFTVTLLEPSSITNPPLNLGGTYTQFDIRGDNYAFQDLVDEVYSQSTDITFGFNCNILFPMKGRSLLSFNNEFIYNTYYVNSYSRSPETGDQYGSLYTEFGFSYINWNMILRYYYYPIGDFNVYTNIGYSFGYAVQVTNYERKESHFNTTRIREGEAIKDPNDYEFGYLVGLGADYGRFSLEMRFERRDGMIPYFGVGAKTTRYYALLGYKLGKIKRKKF